MSITGSLELYGLSRSVYTRIARLALEEKQVPYTLNEVEIFGPSGVPPEHLERHPFGRIPVLVHDGFSTKLARSHAISTRHSPVARYSPPHLAHGRE